VLLICMIIANLTRWPSIVDCLEDWSRANKFQLNCDKCKDLLPRGGKWPFQESIYVVWFRAIIEVLYKIL